MILFKIKIKFITSQLTLRSNLISLRPVSACTPTPQTGTTTGATELWRSSHCGNARHVVDAQAYIPAWLRRWSGSCPPSGPAQLPNPCGRATVRLPPWSLYRHPSSRSTSPHHRLFLWPCCAITTGIADSRS